MAYVDYNNVDSISTLHPDIIQTQILTRLDGPTLTSTASTSSYLQTLCTEQKLWQELSTTTWPSTNDPRVIKAISSFPSGYRSFFADSYPFTEHTCPSEKDEPTAELISAVDLYYKEELIYSNVQEMETESGKAGWFLSAPFRVDMLDQKEPVKTKIRYPGGDYEAWVRDMEESVKLNWILIDPVKRRAANISSRDAVSAKRNWLTGDLEIRFSTVVTTGEKRAAEVATVVSCGSAETWKEVDEEVGGEVHVREVRLQVEDVEGKCLKGRESLVILQGLLEGKRSRKDGEARRGKGRYEEYVEMKTDWRKNKERREKVQDTVFMVFGFSLFVLLWSFVLLR